MVMAGIAGKSLRMVHGAIGMSMCRLRDTGKVNGDS